MPLLLCSLDATVGFDNTTALFARAYDRCCCRCSFVATSFLCRCCIFPVVALINFVVGGVVVARSVLMTLTPILLCFLRAAGGCFASFSFD